MSIHPTNESVIATLKQLSEEYKKHPKEKTDIYRAKAYDNAIKSIRNFPDELSVENLHQIKLGKKTQEKVLEILNTHGLKKLDRIREERKNPIYDLFINIYGAGDVAVKRWINTGYKTLEDLLTDPNLTHGQKLGIKYYDELNSKIPRSEIDRLNDYLKQTFACINTTASRKYVYTICGSYRRGEITSNDIDIVISEMDGNINRQFITTLLHRINILTDDLSMGDKKYMGIALTSDGKHRRLDIEWTQPKELMYSLVYFTGPKDLNVHMRIQAKKRGLTLNEKGLFDSRGNSPFAESERDVFDSLDIDYVEPDKRNIYKA